MTECFQLMLAVLRIVCSGVVEGEHGAFPQICLGGTPFPQMISGQREWWYSSIPPSRLAEKCKVYGKLILKKVMETVATRCHILKLKCTKFDYSWGSTPDPSLELTALLRSLADRMPTRLKLAITCLTTSLKRHLKAFYCLLHRSTELLYNVPLFLQQVV